MTGWDLLTWASLVVLGPGAVIVFVAVLRDAGRVLGAALAGEDERSGEEEPGGRT